MRLRSAIVRLLPVILMLTAIYRASTDVGPPVRWDTARLFNPPQTHPAPADLQSPGVTAVFYDGPTFKGNSTRVFAYYGVPDNDGMPVPGMVLVHGGGGTAFPDWVRMWNQRGYAAIAMDNVGALPNQSPNEYPGPSGWDASFQHADDPVQDQWPYHAVANILLAHSLLRSLPGVDANRIGLTGVSWGGYLACIAAGVDDRFKFAAPVYGCGFLGEHSAWSPALELLEGKGRKWLSLWDPKHYLPLVKMPMLWVSGTNDFAYPLESLRQSCALPVGPRTLCIRVRMPHGHGGVAESAEEIHAFANAVLKGAEPLATITGQGRRGPTVWVTFQSPSALAKAELNFTRDAGVWQRRWETTGARVDAPRSRMSAVLPQGARAYYFNLMDERGLIVSSEHVVIE
jgi:dienelactone hydrolase